MNRAVRYRPAAERDIDDVAEYIARDNIDAAIRFCLTVREDAERLATMPGLGPLYGLSDPALADLRFWPISGFRNYLMFYRRLEDGIEVVRVLHGARDLERQMRGS